MTEEINIMTKIIKLPVYTEEMLAHRGFSINPSAWPQDLKMMYKPEYMEIDWDEVIADYTHHLRYHYSDAKEMGASKYSDVIDVAMDTLNCSQIIRDDVDSHFFWADKVTYVWKNYSDIFAVAFDLYSTSKWNWGLPCPIKDAQKVEISDDFLRSFELELARSFAKGDSSRVCTVHVIRNDERQLIVQAEVDGESKMVLWHDDNGVVHRERKMFAFEIGFRYDRKRETLEFSGPVSSKKSRELKALFIDLLFGQSETRIIPYKVDLSLIKEKTFVLHTSPEIGVQATMEHIFVKWIKNGRRTMLCTGGDWDSIPDAIRFNYPNEPTLCSLNEGMILATHITFSFQGRRERRARTLQVDVDAEKQRISFRTVSKSCQNTVLDCLKEWGMINDH